MTGNVDFIIEPFTRLDPHGREVLYLDGTFELSFPNTPDGRLRFRTPTIADAKHLQRQLEAATGQAVTLLFRYDPDDTVVMVDATASPLDELAVDGWAADPDPTGGWAP